ncbi:MAG: hypothetical protein NZ866_02690 [Patescibacteria group bacterium]|nr:hypothetical protein [Patescibacteria group bacterium]
MWVTNGSVNAIVEDKANKRVYIGGYFTQVGPYTGGGLRLNATNGNMLEPLNNIKNFRVNGYVYTAVRNNSGGFYIGGLFNRIGTTTIYNIAHILPDGTVNPNFNPNANDAVYSLALSPDGSTLYVGGDFTSIGG